ncbi:nucleotidyltransferase domain-containing protein [Paenibacillus sp. 32352]|uniref:nucleotidyltransferase domain-containing protein n=1 Tax=Paenibacillus sp. 32352 TaxID=1969111 RepID=UPI0015C42A4E|nr:nucleotidyltransferase domain-containing protein [Paenibacillus sp. 32352]
MAHPIDFISDFLQHDLSQREDVETVVLCGSYANGKAAEHSDVDLCYIGAFDHFQRESIYYCGREFQIMIAPWAWYEHVVKDYERKGNIATITIMLATGRCLIGDNGRWRELQALAHRFYHEGPKAPSADETRKLRVQLTDLWEDYLDIIDDREKEWLSFVILQECVNTLFVTRRWWAVKPKYQLKEIKSRNVSIADLLERCLASPGSKEELETLCSYVLEPIGGWMKEGWKA